MIKSILTSAMALILGFTSWIVSAADTPTITATELLNNKQKYQVLDVRSADEFNEGHIEGAINIPHYAILDEIAQLKKIDKTIVVYCRSGRRAGKAEAMMQRQGLTNFVHLEGDMLGWKKQDLPLVKTAK